MNKKFGTVIIVLIVIILGWYVLSHKRVTAPQDANALQESSIPQDGSTPLVNTQNNDAQVATSPLDTKPVAPVSVAKEFTVEGSNFKFVPSAISVNKGDTVKITFKNVSGFHDFKIDAFNVATKQIQGGSQEVVTFTADKTGTFEYYCSVGTHRAMGMKGTLMVK